MKAAADRRRLTSVDWVYDFFEEGLQLLEQLLAKHAAFLDYLAATERS